MTTRAACNLAKSSAINAGQEILRMRAGEVLATDWKEDKHQSLRTNADRASEDLIRRAVAEIFPSHSFRGEEAGGETEVSSDWEWIVDPIDGSNNFEHGSADFGISIALAYRGIPVVGVLHYPAHQEMVVAVYEEGVHIIDTASGKQSALSLPKRDVTLQQSMIDFEFSPVLERENEVRDYILRIAQNIKLLKIINSCTRAIGLLLKGEIDGLVFPAPEPYDVAAGLVCLREAGLAAKGLDGPIDLAQGSVPLIAARDRNLLHQLDKLLNQGK